MNIGSGLAQMQRDLRVSWLRHPIGNVAVNVLVFRRDAGVLVVQMREGGTWKLPQRSVGHSIIPTPADAFKYVLRDDLGLLDRNALHSKEIEPLGNWENQIPSGRKTTMSLRVKDIHVGLVSVAKGAQVSPNMRRYGDYVWARSRTILAEQLGNGSDDSHRANRAQQTLTMVDRALELGLLPGWSVQ